jgi:hypothetical protein
MFLQFPQEVSVRCRDPADALRYWDTADDPEAVCLVDEGAHAAATCANLDLGARCAGDTGFSFVCTNMSASSLGEPVDRALRDEGQGVLCARAATGGACEPATTRELVMSGEAPSGPTTIACLADGRFSAEALCRGISCGAHPPVVNGEASPSGAVPYGGTVLISCSEGFRLSGLAPATVLPVPLRRITGTMPLTTSELKYVLKCFNMTCAGYMPRERDIHGRRCLRAGGVRTVHRVGGCAG